MRFSKIGDSVYLNVWTLTSCTKNDHVYTSVYLSEQTAYRTLIQWVNETIEGYGPQQDGPAQKLFAARRYADLQIYLTGLMAQEAHGAWSTTTGRA